MTAELKIEQSSDWSFFQKIGFRFAFILFALIIIFENNGAYPFWNYLHFMYHGLEHFIPWVGKHVLDISWEISTDLNGSGDTTFDFVIYFCCVALACLGCVIWTALDRKRPNYDKLYYWLTVFIRYYIAFMLFMYGLVKIFKTQFPDPGLYRLSEPYGNSTPMGLAWTYFGFSRGYNWFVGIAEMCALLLLFRRTTTFGAIITLFTSLNILAVNLFFDVPVKFLSLTLVLMCLFLLLRDFKRLWFFFFSERQISLPKISPPRLPKKWMRISKGALKAFLIGYVVVWGTYQFTEEVSGWEVPANDKLQGVYEINEFQFIADSSSGSNPKIFRWKQVVISDMNRVAVRKSEDSVAFYKLRIFIPDSSMTFVPADPAFKDLKEKFRFNINDSSNIILSGRMNGDSVRFVLHQLVSRDSAYRLTRTGFHWISDKPNNH